MALTLKQNVAIAEIAELLSDFVPASGSAAWVGHRNLQRIAQEVGVADFWPGGSKKPALRQLLGKTMELRVGLFEKLVITIVHEGIARHRGKKTAIRRDQIEALNVQLLVAGWKFPELVDQHFLHGLAGSALPVAEVKVARSDRADRLRAFERLRTRLYELHEMSDKQAAGRLFEAVLQDLFELSKLTPRAPFKIVGEQVDGSIELDAATYLIEAKWTHAPASSSDVLTFHAKVVGRSAFTRGIFISLNGISDEAREALTRGRTPVMFIVDGSDLTRILHDEMPLDTFLRRRRRLLDEEGAVTAPFKRIAT